MKINNVSGLIVATVLSLAVLSCSAPNTVNPVSEISIGETKYNNSITFKINTSNFRIKSTSSSDNIPKIISNVSYYKVYLLKNASDPYPSTGDPLADAVSGVGPFTITSTGVSGQTVTLKNLPPSGGAFYHIAVRAFDTSDNELIKINTGWTGSSLNGRIAVSTNGVSVDNNYQVNTPFGLNVNIGLDDGKGARIDFTTTLSNPTYNSTVNRQSGVIDLVAGLPPLSYIPQNKLDIGINFGGIYGLGLDKNNNVYFSSKNMLAKLDTLGKIKLIAGCGNSTCGSSPDTSGSQDATSVSLPIASKVSFDSSGNIYISDTFNSSIEKIDTTVSPNKIKVIAGCGSACSTLPDTSGTQSPLLVHLSSPGQVTTDSSDNIYLADQTNAFVEKIDSVTGKIKVIAGGGASVPNTSGTQDATSVVLHAPLGIHVDGSGNIYFTDRTDLKAYKINTSGKIKLFAGCGSFGCGPTSDTSGTQDATAVSFSTPGGLTTDTSGNIYIFDASKNDIVKVLTTGKIKLIAGCGIGCGSSPDSSGTQDATVVNLNVPEGIEIDNSGNLYISENNSGSIEEIFTTGKIKVIGAGGSKGKADTSGTQDATSVPLSLSVFGFGPDITGNLYLTDTTTKQLEKVDLQTKKIKVIAGGGASTPDTTGTQDATSVAFTVPTAVTADRLGNVFVKDIVTLSKIDTTTGKIKLFAGCGLFGCGPTPDTSGTQNATEVEVFGQNVATDSASNLYISDLSFKLLDKVDKNGKIKAVAGCGTACSTLPDTTGTQSATSVSITPNALTVDNSNTIFVFDSGNNFLLKIDTLGKVKVIGGGGAATVDTTGTQDALNISLSSARGVAADNNGNLYISNGNGVSKLDLSTGKIKLFITGSDFIRLANYKYEINFGSTALAVDRYGTLYFQDTVKNIVLRYLQ